jgi:predicted nucleic acid-binding protein
VSLIYDAGVLIAADRNNRNVWADHRVRLELGLTPFTTAPVIAQVSRSARQAQLRRFLRGCEVLPFSQTHAHKVGALLGKAHTSDVVDAHVAVVASEIDAGILTSDPHDLRHLVNHLSRRVVVQTLDE